MEPPPTGRGTDDALGALDDALARFVPKQFLELLGKRAIVDVVLGEAVERKLTILFLDIRDSRRCARG